MGVQGKNKGNFVVGRMSSDNLNIASVTLTNAQILAVRATPITLVPAQGAGTVIEFVSGMLFLDASAGAYTESADNLILREIVIHGSGNGEFGGGNAANDLIVKVGYRVHASGF
jgi:hypothetical protein